MSGSSTTNVTSEQMSLTGSLPPQQALQSPTNTRRFFMWFCAACFYFFQFILRTSPSVIATDLMRSLAIDGLGLGILVSYYYIIF